LRVIKRHHNCGGRGLVWSTTTPSRCETQFEHLKAKRCGGRWLPCQRLPTNACLQQRCKHARRTHHGCETPGRPATLCVKGWKPSMGHGCTARFLPSSKYTMTNIPKIGLLNCPYAVQDFYFVGGDKKEEGAGCCQTEPVQELAIWLTNLSCLCWSQMRPCFW
jgi:hypothetical protein